MQHSSAILLSIPLLSCTSTEESILWEGYLFEQSTDGVVPLEDSFLEIIDETGSTIAEGDTPTGRPSHYQRLTLTPDLLEKPVELRVSSPTTIPILWSGESPSKSATWLAGGLFAIERDFGLDFLNTFATTVDQELTGTVHLWGEPFRPEEWIDVEISIFDADQEYPIYTFSQLPNGLISTNVETGIDWFFAWNLPSRPLTLQIDTLDGSTITTMYHPQEGDILSALYYALPLQETTP